MRSPMKSNTVRGALVNSGTLHFQNITTVVRPVSGTKHIDGVINDSGDAYHGSVVNLTLTCSANYKAGYHNRGFLCFIYNMYQLPRRKVRV